MEATQFPVVKKAGREEAGGEAEPATEGPAAGSSTMIGWWWCLVGDIPISRCPVFFVEQYTISFDILTSKCPVFFLEQHSKL
jgi:hypothetical protein